MARAVPCQSVQCVCVCVYAYVCMYVQVCVWFIHACLHHMFWLALMLRFLFYKQTNLMGLQGSPCSCGFLTMSPLSKLE